MSLSHSIQRKIHWRCCPWEPPGQTEDDDCKYNNPAYDYLEFSVKFVENINVKDPNYSVFDKHFIDVYIKEASNTQWKRHTHPIEWRAPFGRINPADNGDIIRIATVYCSNHFNKLYKCGLHPFHPDAPNKQDDQCTQEYQVETHAYRMRDGKKHTLPTANGFGSDYRGCIDHMLWFGEEIVHDRFNIPGTERQFQAHCSNGAFRYIEGPGCAGARGTKNPPLPWICTEAPVRRGEPPDDFSKPEFSGELASKGGDMPGGPPDSLKNNIVSIGTPEEGTLWADIPKTGPNVGQGAHYWDGTVWTWGVGAAEKKAMLIGGEYYDEDGVPGTAPYNPPEPTGSGCGTCTFYWDDGVTAWVESYYSDSCSGVNCRCPMPPWPPGSVHGETKSTGCDTIT